MGSREIFQPLTREDKVTVVLYRAGIAISAVIVSVLALLLKTASSNFGTSTVNLSADMLVYGLYAAVGMSVFFIHLYVGTFKKILKNLYYLSLAGLAALIFIGKGSPSAALAQEPYCALLLLPLSGCLGFVTAKEAFCFKLFEGYLLAMIMPLYLLVVSKNTLSSPDASYGLILIAAMLVIFTLRKVFMPVAYDIGDKTAYR